jgi:hypothetical protein
VSYEFALEHHVTGLHVDLVELSERARPVLDHVRNGVDGSPEINLVAQWVPSFAGIKARALLAWAGRAIP